MLLWLSPSDDMQLCRPTSGFVDDVMFSHNRAYMMYVEAYG